jgi:hypothetical protein
LGWVGWFWEKASGTRAGTVKAIMRIGSFIEFSPYCTLLRFS